jgi:hypothetical protein
MAWKALVVISGLLVSCLPAFAADEPAFMPMDPVILGQGGAVEASAHGYDSFFSNPAGYSRSPGSVTVMSLETWIYSRPQGLLDIFGGIAGGASSSTMEGIMATETASGGFGGGGSMGIGFAGNGLGLGVFLLLDSCLSGDTLADATGDVTTTVAFIGGLSVPLKVLGMTVHVGGDVRPMIRIHAPVGSGAAPAVLDALSGQTNLLTALAPLNALYGLGVALDLGLIAEAGALSFGVSVRDLGGTTFDYARSTVGAVQTGLSTGLRFPPGTVPPESSTVPMSVNAGFALHPDMGTARSAFDPVVHLDVLDIVGLVTGQRAPWTYLHAGLETTIASVFAVRAGLSQGYLTGGFGLHMVFLDLNAAIFTREMGTQQWESPSSGATLELAVRF